MSPTCDLPVQQQQHAANTATDQPVKFNLMAFSLTSISSLPLLPTVPTQPFAQSPRDPRGCPAVLASGAIPVPRYMSEAEPVSTLPMTAEAWLQPSLLPHTDTRAGSPSLPSPIAVPLTTPTRTSHPDTKDMGDVVPFPESALAVPALGLPSATVTPSQLKACGVDTAEMPALEGVGIEATATDKHPSGRTVASLVPRRISFEADSEKLHASGQAQVDAHNSSAPDHSPSARQTGQAEQSARHAGTITCQSGLAIAPNSVASTVGGPLSAHKAFTDRSGARSSHLMVDCEQWTSTDMSRQSEIVLETMVKQLQGELQVSALC